MDTPFRIEHHTLGAMPYLTVRPRAGGPYPAVIALHGFTGDKETMLPLAVPLALANFVVACPDARYHGARRDEAWMQWAEHVPEIGVYQSATETAAELSALVDALLARPDVRPSGDDGVGIAGVSMGGVTMQAAIPHERRFTVAVSLISGGVWGELFNERFAHIPADLREKMLARSVDRNLDAFARLALLILSGAEDPQFPPETVRAFHDALRPTISEPARLHLVIEPGIGHTVTETMGREAIAWFRRWLR